MAAEQAGSLLQELIDWIYQELPEGQSKFLASKQFHWRGLLSKELTTFTGQFPVCRQVGVVDLYPFCKTKLSPMFIDRSLRGRNISHLAVLTQWHPFSYSSR